MSTIDRVVVIGASGFGRECLDVLEAMVVSGSPIVVIGVVDDAPSGLNLERLTTRGVTYLGTVEEWLSQHENEVYVLGIGHPAIRRNIVAQLDAAGARAIAAVHPSATFGAGSETNEGLVVCAGATVSTNVKIGRHVHINPNATVGHDAVLQDYVSLNPACVISGEVLVGSDALVGAAATVLQGLVVGAGSIVGAGSVVTKDVPDGVIVKGVPGVWT